MSVDKKQAPFYLTCMYIFQKRRSVHLYSLYRISYERSKVLGRVIMTKVSAKVVRVETESGVS